MKFLTIEKKECRTTVRLFGHTVFRFGEKRRGIYDMKSILENYTGVKTKVKRYEIQHGWMFEVSKYDLEKDIEFMLVWNKKMKTDWETKSKVPCHIITAPFVTYRRMNNINKNPEAKGTIAYPIHATAASKPDFDIEQYCKDLKSLPDEFQPVTVSLHHSDIEEYHWDKAYEKYGINTVCASYNQGNKQFYEAFYDILKNYKYATSNEPGTCMLYAVEAGIPFFLCGASCTLKNTGNDKNIGSASVDFGEFPEVKKYRQLFVTNPTSGINITEEQKNVVEEEIGLNDCLSKEELKEILKTVKE